MIQNAIALINNLQNDQFLREMTKKRSLASVPTAGKYRMIDFPLSNLSNSGIYQVGILVRSRYNSLLDHLRSGKEWGLARKKDGLYILPPSFENDSNTCRGMLDCFYQNLDYLRRSHEDYVIISGTNVICNINFTAAFEQHLETKADITVIYNTPSQRTDVSDYAVLELSENHKVTAIEGTPVTIPPNNVSMEMYIIRKDLLYSLVERCVAKGEYDFVMNLLVKNSHHLNIFGYKHEGYVARINSVQSYFEHNMDLLTPKVWKSLFSTPGQVYTKIKDSTPTKYLIHASTKNCVISDECVIDGDLENCILARSVVIKKGAKLKNCVVMEGCVIESNAVLHNIILDKQVKIGEGKKMMGVPEYPVIIEKKAVI